VLGRTYLRGELASSGGQYGRSAADLAAEKHKKSRKWKKKAFL
jgi:hypothetical protein